MKENSDIFQQYNLPNYNRSTRFNMTIKSVRASQDVAEKAGEATFRLKSPTPHRAIISVVRPIKGPQDITLELTMERYHLGRYQAPML